MISAGRAIEKKLRPNASLELRQEKAESFAARISYAASGMRGHDFIPL
jgi:hypothetical protein